jgi:ribonuclease BN (tRNA processing enzyme)
MRAFFEAPGSRLPASVVQHIITSHTDPADVGRLAAEAGVRTLVLTHFVPSEPTGHIPEAEWIAAARRHFSGEILAGRDLMEI